MVVEGMSGMPQLSTTGGPPRERPGPDAGPGPAPEEDGPVLPPPGPGAAGLLPVLVGTVAPGEDAAPAACCAANWRCCASSRAPHAAVINANAARSAAAR